MSFHKNLYNEIQDNDLKIKALSKKTGIKRQQLYRYYTGKTEQKYIQQRKYVMH